MDHTTPPSAGSAGRVRSGRFSHGNRSGTGNPFAKRTADLHRALLDAVEPRMIEGMVKRMVRAALEGDVAAAKVIFDRVLGRAAPTVLRLPAIVTAADLPKALNKILQAAGRGKITADHAAAYAGIVDVAGRAIAAVEVDERLLRLETGAGLGPRELV